MLKGDSPIAWRIAQINERVSGAKSQDLYLYQQEAEAVDSMHVTINGRKMLQFASYSYLDLLGHPKIDAAAREAIDQFSSGTHGVRILAGTITLHNELEQTIADFKGTESAIVYSSGFVCNYSTIAALVGRNDVVISDKLNHASIVDGCLMSRAKFMRVAHNDMEDLEKTLASVPAGKGKLVVADAVFSMDGDILNLPDVVGLCNKYEALLMIDEAHSVGVIGKTGRGIEEYFGMKNVIDLKMGTLSKTIPSVGGYIAASEEMVSYLKHASRAFIFSAALPPASTAAAKAAFEVILDEPERVALLQRNVDHFINGLQARGFDTLDSETPIVPIIVGNDERAWLMSKMAQEQDIFVLPVVTPAVPAHLARLRANVTSGHTLEEIDLAMDIFKSVAEEVGFL